MTNRKLALSYTLVSLLFIFIAFYVYAAVAQHDFLHWDDNMYINANPHIQKLSGNNLWWMLTQAYASNWHPLTWLSHAIDFALWGDKPKMHHLGNVFLHAINTICFFFLILSLLKSHSVNKKNPQTDASFTALRTNFYSFISAFIAALFFLLHPQHIESVAWAAERKDLLSALFFMLSIIAYLKYAKSTENQHYKTLSVFLFIFALMSKSMAISLPLVLLILDYYPLRRISLANRVREQFWPLIKEKYLFFLVAIAVALITLITQFMSGATRSFEEVSLLVRFLNASYSIFFYIYKFILPTNLSAFYPYPEWISDLDPVSFLAPVALILVTGLAIVAARNGSKYWISGWLYYLISVFPVIGIVQVGDQAAADRYTYLPMLGFYILIGLALVRFAKIFTHSNTQKFIVFTCVLIIGFALGGITKKQLATWKNDKTLWQNVIRLYPHQVSVAYGNLGNIYYEENNFNDAVINYIDALEINPKSTTTRLNLALTYEKLGDNNKAYLEYTSVAKKTTLPTDTYMKIGDALIRLKYYSKARELYTKALIIEPDSEIIALAIARTHIYLGKLDAAERILLHIVGKNTTNIDANSQLANVYFSQKRFKQAQVFYQKVLTIDAANSLAIQRIKQINAQ
ncbi:MAG: tetratricopeptide repeat protein [Thiohalomonadales bacterium]